jgi:hypothetical protein
MRTRSAGIAIMVLLVAAPAARAANIVLSQTSITMSVRAGQSGATTVGASLASPPSFPFMFNVELLPTGGSLPAAWLTTRPAQITHTATSKPLPLVITVPPSARAGAYTGVLQPVARNVTFPLAPPNGPLLVNLTVTSTCSSAPTITLAPGTDGELWPPDGRIENLVVAGSVAVPSGCTLRRAWFELEDEYGEHDTAAEISPAADGSFSAAAPIQVSRRGNDRDGRAYRLTVKAEDEAGSAQPATLIATVKHDQRGGK